MLHFGLGISVERQSTCSIFPLGFRLEGIYVRITKAMPFYSFFDPATSTNRTPGKLNQVVLLIAQISRQYRYKS
jgi:hypothetical protein